MIVPFAKGQGTAPAQSDKKALEPYLLMALAHMKQIGRLGQQQPQPEAPTSGEK